jgi:hypothetical protein
MPLTKVSFSVIQVANNVTSTTVGNTTSIPSFTFDQNGVITSASNVTPSIANTQITGVITASQLATSLNLATNNVQVASIQSATGTPGITFAANGQVTLSNTILQLTGGQIKFPATQIASGDGNTLDDYEEGTWTPIDASGAGLTLSVVSGAGSSGYVKIGQMVYAVCSINYPSTGSGAGATIGGLPYASIAGANGGYWGGITRYTTNSVVVMAAVAPENTVFNLYIGSGTGVSNSYVSNLRYDFIFMYRTSS